MPTTLNRSTVEKSTCWFKKINGWSRSIAATSFFVLFEYLPGRCRSVAAECRSSPPDIVERVEEAGSR
jgi:hypothetical protein